MRTEISVDVVQEMITGANVNDPLNCIGARALKTIAHEFTDDKIDYCLWGAYSGKIHTDKEEITVDSYYHDSIVDMMSLKEPVTVDFKVRERIVKQPMEYD